MAESKEVARAIDRLECTRGRDCQCTEPEEAWICRYSHLPAKATPPSDTDSEGARG